MKRQREIVCVLFAVVAAQIGCEAATLDLRGAQGPIDMPPLELTGCELAGHACIPFEQTSRNELCLDDSQPFNDECDRYNSPFGKALCCAKVELSFCEQVGNRCVDADFGTCPWGYEMEMEQSCDAPGRPVGKVCCAPIPCIVAGYECIGEDPQFPGVCPAGFDQQELACATSREFGAPAICCSLRM